MAFHLFAIVEEGRARAVKHVRTNRALQKELADLLNGQAEVFLDQGIERIPFQGTYSVESDELFIIETYDIWADLEASRSNRYQKFTGRSPQ